MSDDSTTSASQSIEQRALEVLISIAEDDSPKTEVSVYNQVDQRIRACEAILRSEDIPRVDVHVSVDPDAGLR